MPRVIATQYSNYHPPQTIVGSLVHCLRGDSLFVFPMFMTGHRALERGVVQNRPQDEGIYYNTVRFGIHVQGFSCFVATARAPVVWTSHVY